MSMTSSAHPVDRGERCGFAFTGGAFLLPEKRRKKAARDCLFFKFAGAHPHF
jgi:hypothetical protein